MVDEEELRKVLAVRSKSTARSAGPTTTAAPRLGQRGPSIHAQKLNCGALVSQYAFRTEGELRLSEPSAEQE